MRKYMFPVAVAVALGMAAPAMAYDTGGLMSMTRQEAWEQVAQVGGIPEPSVTKRTNVLVAGDINPATLAPGTVTTGKAAKAFALQDKGQDIELMTEDDFLRAL